MMALHAATVITVILGVASFTLYADRPPARPPQTAAVAPSGAQPAPAVPLTWTADSQVWEGGCDHDYVIAKAPHQVPPPPAPQDAAAWAATQGAVHGRETAVRISVQGRSDTAVVLEDLRVRVVGRTHPAPGTVHYWYGSVGSRRQWTPVTD